jgi:outer membrane lipoprotein-sorting protein
VTRRRATGIALVVFLRAGNCPGANPAETAEVVSRMTRMDDARLQALREYSSTRRYTLENRRFGTKAELRVSMSYRQPGTKKFEVLSELGSAVIRKAVLQKLIRTEIEASEPALRAATRIGPENYTFTLAGREERDGRSCYILEVEPKSRTRYLFTGRIWVDAEDFAVTRIEGSPAVRPSIWVRKTAFVHTYRKVDGFWLPESNRSESDVRVYGPTVVTVEYGDYRVAAAPVGAARTGGND